MWAQLVKFTAQPGHEAELERLGEEWEEQVGRGTDSGWQSTQVFRSNANPNVYHELVIFESEEKARANERSPKHLEIVEKMGSLMAAEPEFIDLTPVHEGTR